MLEEFEIYLVFLSQGNHDIPLLILYGVDKSLSGPLTLTTSLPSNVQAVRVQLPSPYGLANFS